ncbi:hypothetical protein HAP94_00840 [Acidithiobacillus ferrivorans]|nr:hypothetical protein [Acidithiobacillus ferrivorans]
MDVIKRRIGGDRYRDQVIALASREGFQVGDSTYKQDMHEASDLLLNGEGCALRIRAEKALQRWPDEFTIRAWRPGTGPAAKSACTSLAPKSACTSLAPVAASRASRGVADSRGEADSRACRQHVDTEFQKIMDGHARYALYGFTDSTDKIVLMRLLDLNVFRTCVLGDTEKYDQLMRTGADGVGYLVFNVHEFPDALVACVWDYRH